MENSRVLQGGVGGSPKHGKAMFLAQSETCVNRSLARERDRRRWVRLADRESGACTSTLPLPLSPLSIMTPTYGSVVPFGKG